MSTLNMCRPFIFRILETCASGKGGPLGGAAGPMVERVKEPPRPDARCSTINMRELLCTCLLNAGFYFCLSPPASLYPSYVTLIVCPSANALPPKGKLIALCWIPFLLRNRRFAVFVSYLVEPIRLYFVGGHGNRRLSKNARMGAFWSKLMS